MALRRTEGRKEDAAQEGEEEEEVVEYEAQVNNKKNKKRSLGILTTSPGFNFNFIASRKRKLN